MEPACTLAVFSFQKPKPLFIGLHRAIQTRTQLIHKTMAEERPGALSNFPACGARRAYSQFPPGLESSSKCLSRGIRFPEREFSDRGDSPRQSRSPFR